MVCFLWFSPGFDRGFKRGGKKGTAIPPTLAAAGSCPDHTAGGTHKQSFVNHQNWTMGNLFSKTRTKQVLVHFNGKKHRVVFSKEDYNADNKIPLQKFRTKLAKSLQVPATSLKLYKLKPSQTQLENMGATLESYGLKSGSELLAVREEPKPAAAAPVSAGEQVKQIMASVEADIGGRLHAFVANPPADAETRETEHRVLSETVLARLISLDNVEIATPEERAERKAAIAKLHKYHEDVDKARDAPAAAAAAQEPTNTPNDAAAPKADAPEVAPKAEAPQAETPKAEVPKAEAPKAEAPKAEAPKAEAPKAEVPKAEVPKAEVPKAEAPKAEVPKAEVPKAEAPKAEVPKAEVPKAEVPKAEVPKETPKAETPKVEVPKAEVPKAEAPKVETPNLEEAAPKTEASKVEEAVETPKAEAPKTEAPKVEEAAKEAPKAETPKAEVEEKIEAAKADVPKAEAPKVEETVEAAKSETPAEPPKAEETVEEKAEETAEAAKSETPVEDKKPMSKTAMKNMRENKKKSRSKKRR